MDEPWEEFHAQACANLVVSADRARLGYRLSSAGRRSAPIVLGCENDYLRAMETIVNQAKAARTKPVTLEVLDLVCSLSIPSLSQYLTS